MDTSARFGFRLLVIIALSFVGIAVSQNGLAAAHRDVAPLYAMQDLGDFDDDGIPNHADPDDDNDGVTDEMDPEPLNADVWEVAPPAEEPVVTPTPEPAAPQPETPTDPPANPDDEVTEVEPVVSEPVPAPVQVSSLPETGTGSTNSAASSLLAFSAIMTTGLLALVLREAGRGNQSM